MAMVLIPGITGAVNAAGSKAAGILGLASTAGFVRNAVVSVSGVTSGAAGRRCRIVALTASTLNLVFLDDANGIPLKGTNKSDLSAFAVADVITQEEQFVDLKPWEVPVADAQPVRIA